MISVQEAKSILYSEAAGRSRTITMPLASANGYILSESVVSPSDSPPFDQVAMDGYAFQFDTIRFDQPVPVSGMMQAGETQHKEVQPGTVFQVFTGAPLPKGADTVVMVEWTSNTKDGIVFSQKPETKGTHIRPLASQIQHGEVALEKGIQITPGIVGYLASIGIKEINVYAKPSIAILVTGNELVKPGNPLSFGQVYESNSVMLVAALAEAGIVPVSVNNVGDQLEATVSAVSEALSKADIVLITGGISVGKFDFVQEAFKQNGIQTLFYKIKQKPGKPLFAGKSDKHLVFGLPGNPASVLTCFYQYVVPCIRLICGKTAESATIISLPLGTSYSKKPGLTQFLKAQHKAGVVYPSDNQESYKLNAFSEANGLVEIPEMAEVLQAGELVKFYPLNRIWDA